jgi:Contractile injection system tube protein
MPDLRKATLTPISGDADPKPLGAPIPVQFNPSSLHLVLASAADTGQTPARQAEQHLGSGNLTLTLDLHFDTADEGTTESPRNVRDKTAQVAQFMLPSKGSSDPPPRVRFHWGDFILDGVMGNYSEDVDLFSPQGVPLRAKVSITIRGQNPDFAANAAGPGAKTGAGATAPGATAGAPGSIGFGASLSVGASLGVSAGIGIGGGVEISVGDQVGIAIGGESAAEFTARMGADPEAWRGVAAGLDSTVSIEAGTAIGFSPALSTGAGVGAATGVEAGRAPASPAAAVGLAGAAAAPARPGTAPAAAAGFALTAAGGVQAAVETVRIVETGAAAAGAKAAYGESPPAPGAARAAPPAPPVLAQPRPRLVDSGLAVAAAQTPAPPAPPPPRADPRATSFGRGIPLRPRVNGAAGARAGALGAGAVLVGIRARTPTQAPASPDPTVPPWRALPAGDRTRVAAEAAQQWLRPTTPCGCGGDCGCGRGGGCR